MRVRLLVLLWISSVCLAQAPGIDWEYSSTLGSDFRALSLREDGLGETVAVGYTDLNFEYDLVLRRLSSSGALLWSTQIPGSDDEQGTGISLSAGSGYAICSWQSSFGGPSDFYLRLFNASGSLTTTFAYGSADDERPEDIQTTSDFGYVMCGYREQSASGKDFHIVKTDFAGALQWTKTYGGPAEDVARAVVQTPDNGYIVVGETQSFGLGGRDMWILRLDANGDSLWSWAVLSPLEEAAFGVALTSDGGFAVAGYQDDFVDVDVLLVKFASNAAFMWSVTFDNGGYDYAFDVEASADDGLVLCGRSDASGSDDAVVWKFDEIGQHYWTVTTGGASGDGAYEIRQLASGGYAYCGYLGNPQAEATNWYVVELQSDTPLDGPLPVELLSFGAVSTQDGIELNWETASETGLSYFEIWRGVEDNFSLLTEIGTRGNSTSGERYTYEDNTVAENTAYLYYLTVVNLNGEREELRDRMVTASWSGAAAVPEVFALKAYPNPFNPTTTIEFTMPEAGNVSLSIFDNNGRLVEMTTRAANAGTVSFEWNAEGRTSGTYFARVMSSGVSKVVPLVLLK